MKVILMNKNTEILEAFYDSDLKVFLNIIAIKNIAYAPYIIKTTYDKYGANSKELKKIISEWFKGRGIPSWRDNLDSLLNKLNITSPTELLDKAFGLSLSDQYWVKPSETNILYDDINFFNHDFNAIDFFEATFTNDKYIVNNELSLKTPNNTTDGMLKKVWIIENNKRYLLKGGYKGDLKEPLNEVLASIICQRLGFSHIPYTVEIIKNNLVSKCECITNENTEIIPAYQIMYNKKHYKNIIDFEEYVNELESHGIKNAREKIENMYILDFLIMNEDRHLNNFGIIRDVNTLEWIDVCPIFDNGKSLNIINYDDNIVVSNEGHLFYEIKSFDRIINIVKNLKRIDLKKLDGVVEEYRILLNKYQNITNMSSKRIASMCEVLNNQINKLRDKIEKN